VIQAFADKIVRLLKVRDPLSETVHLGPVGTAGVQRRWPVASETTRRDSGDGGPVSKPAAGA